ncbi:hypothetical protein R3W88_021602 [Solanum pinnatisectum]|uniref:Sugar phosphate transporter domain-containing protein n=1 Tax=Solanum pinnatisectum TaxID=50273 RepID=A0AAV9LVP5_9SOLN|nr:hypothetical protein R3W88_021602 [Solanum pinnatisectum]
MVEAQSWTTRRGSNPRLESPQDQVLDMPVTPTAEIRQQQYSNGSTAGRALKSVVQGLLLSSDAEKLHSMNLLLYMAPMAAMILLPFTLYIEGNVAAVTVEKAKGDGFMVFLLIGNATVAYLVNLTNFLVTKHTSALTLQVLGNAKAAVAAVVSVLIFRNPVNIMGITGFAVTVMGVVLYSEAKKRSKVTAH